MRITYFVLCLIIFGSTALDALPKLTFISSITLNSYASHRDIRLYAGNSNQWLYEACVADSGPIGSPTGQVFGINILADSTSASNLTGVNSGLNLYTVAQIHGLPECAYAGIQNTSLFNQISQGPHSGEIPDENWQSLYAVWFNNQLQTFLSNGEQTINRINVTELGSYNYAPSEFEQITSWELYQEPNTLEFYIVHSLSSQNNTYSSVVDRCNPDCVTGGVPLDGIAATITANSTHWFSCYIRVLESVGSVITSAIRECRSIEAIPVGWPESIDFEHPINDTINDRMYSCMINDTNMILAVSNSQTQQYTLYSLDTTSYFAVTGRANAQGNQTVRSITCMDQVILVATQSSIDYWVWDNGDGFVFPTPPASVDSTPIIESPSGNQPNPNNTTEGLPLENQVLIGVFIGVGVPLLAGAIVLIILRKKLRKKIADDKKSIYGDNANQTYTSIILPSKDSQMFQKKMHIPFKQISLTKEIGCGSFGKVYLGKWQGNTVAIKKNNIFADTANFLAEAKLTLTMTPHPNLVQTYGVCADSEYPYIVLEYCEGGSLDKVIFNNVCNTKEQRALVLGIAYGLTHLHRHNIVHRDLAARNILLKEGKPKISDFGMSRILKEESMKGKTNTTIGPIRWMAPESVLDMSYSYKSDVWTFGIVVSEIVNGHEPHEGENQLDVAMQIRDKGLTPSIPDNCDPVLQELMLMCWRVNPDDRPAMNEVTDFLNDKFALL